MFVIVSVPYSGHLIEQIPEPPNVFIIVNVRYSGHLLERTPEPQCVRYSECSL